MNVGATAFYKPFVPSGVYRSGVQPPGNQVMASAPSRGYSPGVVINSPQGQKSSPSLDCYKQFLQSAQTTNFTGNVPQSPNPDDSNANAAEGQPVLTDGSITNPKPEVAITVDKAGDLAAKKVKADIDNAPQGTNIGGEIAEQQTAESSIPEEEQSPEQQVDNAINPLPITSVP